MKDDVRDHALTAYFHYCKEKAAKAFIEWRMRDELICKNPEYKKALRFRRLTNFKKYDKEEAVYQLYLEYEDDFESIE